jgi:hypothetical protein
MTNTDHSFGTAVTPPNRPQPLTVPAYGEETRPVYGEESHPSFGEGTLRVDKEGLGPLSIEGETSRRSSTATAEGQTSAFIVGEDREKGH